MQPVTVCYSPCVSCGFSGDTVAPVAGTATNNNAISTEFGEHMETVVSLPTPCFAKLAAIDITRSARRP